MAHQNSTVRGRRRLIQAGVAVAWMIGTGLLWTRTDTMAAAVMGIDSNRWLLTGVLLVVSSALVLRKRATLQVSRAHDWLLALPVSRSMQSTEILFYRLLPVARLIAILWAVLCTVSLIAFCSGLKLPVLLSIGRDSSAGALVGALAGLLISLPKTVDLPPGSRYVPHRRTVTTHVKPSTKALGIWPIRQMFASARPKTLSQLSLVLLLAMPMGASADFAMLIIGLCALLALQCLLIAGMATVTRAARHWLAPLPTATGMLAKALALPSMAFAAASSMLESWLLYLLPMDGARAAAYGVMTLALVLILSVLGCTMELGRRTSSLA